MKRIFLLFVLAACGGGSPTDDAGTNDSGGNDAPSNDSAQSDGAAPDGVASDAPFGDGSLGPNMACDPQNNLCNPTLLCCSEPTHSQDGAATAYVCEPPDNNNQCPKLP